MSQLDQIKKVLTKVIKAKRRTTYNVTIFKEAMSFDSATAEFLTAIDTLKLEDFELILESLNETTQDKPKTN